MEIIDAQVHVNRLVANWQTVDADAVLLAATTTMDALGIDVVLIAESHGYDAQMRPLQAHVLPNGAVRASFPFSRQAMARYPDRFGYLVRIDATDPELEQLVSEVRANPGALCMRTIPLPQTGELDRFAAGEYEPLFAAAERHGVPIFIALPKRLDTLVPYLRKFPKLWVILDHCGVGVAPPPQGEVPPQLSHLVTPTLAERAAELDHVMQLAEHPNLALKWCHAPARLSAEAYPYRDAVARLVRVIEAFGSERVMWGSDFTESRTDQTWAQSLHYVRYSDLLTEEQKEGLLGKSIRHVLNWPRTS
jgi:predicted TIM-barrel fold metal-dependent hydrolase